MALSFPCSVFSKTAALRVTSQAAYDRALRDGWFRSGDLFRHAFEAMRYAQRAARETGSLMPPKHILNAPTKLMKEIGYGKGYAYDHDVEGGFSGDNFFPDEMERVSFYRPKGEGVEARIKERLDRWNAIRAEKARGK